MSRNCHVQFDAIRLMVLSCVLLCIASPLFAESIFLKDGRIVEGKVVTETDKNILIKTADGKTQHIQRTTILRTLFKEDYKTKRYLNKMDGTTIEVYIVDEDDASYTYRLELNSAQEVRISKEDVDSISRRKVEPKTVYIEKKETRQEAITNRAARFRLGLIVDGPFSATSDYAKGHLDPLQGVFFDIVPYRHRNTNGNGIDVLLRGTCNAYNITDYTKTGYYLPSGYTIDDIEFMQFAIGGGLRYVYGTYAGGILWQGYALAYYQYSLVDFSVDQSNKNTSGGNTGNNGSNADSSNTSHGFVGGIGIEIGLSSNFGIFAEYTNGYTTGLPGKKNIEPGVFRFGITLRSLYL